MVFYAAFSAALIQNRYASKASLKIQPGLTLSTGCWLGHLQQRMREMTGVHLKKTIVYQDKQFNDLLPKGHICS